MIRRNAARQRSLAVTLPLGRLVLPALTLLLVFSPPVGAEPLPGAACDDGKRCTAEDVIGESGCTGRPYSCEDGLECTNDVCDGAGGCVHGVAQGYCVIDGRCVADGDVDPDNGCQICDAEAGNADWQPLSGRPCLGGRCKEGLCMAKLRVRSRGIGRGVVLGRRFLCDDECEVELPIGARVRLQAEAGRGSRFAGWSGQCEGTGECVIEVEAGSSVVAEFGRHAPSSPPVQLIVDTFGDGVVTSFPAGVDCGEHCWHTFPHGTTVTLYATPIKGMAFQGWKGGCSGRSRECSIELRAAQMVTASFAKTRKGKPSMSKAGEPVTKRDVSAPADGEREAAGDTQAP